MKIKVVIGVLFAVLFAVSCYVGVVRGEVVEETAVDNGMLTVRTIEKTVLKKEQYAMPSVEVPAHDFPKIRTIVDMGEGEYVVKEGKKSRWRFGVPMVHEKLTAKTVVSFKNGQWGNPNTHASEPEKESSWLMTLAMAIVVVTVASVSINAQRKKYCIDDGRLRGSFLFTLLGVAFAINMSEFVWSGGFRVGLLLVIVGAVVGMFIVEAIVHLPLSMMIVPTVIAAIPASFFRNANQSMEYVMFMALTMLVSYLLAKAVKRFVFNKSKDPIPSAE